MSSSSSRHTSMLLPSSIAKSYQMSSTTISSSSLLSQRLCFPSSRYVRSCTPPELNALLISLRKFVKAGIKFAGITKATITFADIVACFCLPSAQSLSFSLSSSSRNLSMVPTRPSLHLSLVLWKLSFASPPPLCALAIFQRPCAKKI